MLVNEGSKVPSPSEVSTLSHLFLTRFWLKEGHRAKNRVSGPLSLRLSLDSAPVALAGTPTVNTRLEVLIASLNRDSRHANLIAVTGGPLKRTF